MKIQQEVINLQSLNKKDTKTFWKNVRANKGNLNINSLKIDDLNEEIDQVRKF